MSVLLTIGEFSRMTHLSVKALHHYDDVGLLSHAKVDNAALSVMSIRPTARSETFVAERVLAADGPIREHYLVTEGRHG